MATRIKTARRNVGRKSAKPAVPSTKKGSVAASARGGLRSRVLPSAKKKPSKAGSASQRPQSALEPIIFISYRHESPYAQIAQQLFLALLPAATTWRAQVFMDRQALEPADLVDRKILDALDRTTHFIALLSNGYWASPYCRMEIARIVERFENNERVRPLFVKAEEFKLQHYTFDTDRPDGRMRSKDRLLAGVGDLQFLGPYDEARRLQRLQWEEPAALSDQIAQLVNSLEVVIAR